MKMLLERILVKKFPVDEVKQTAGGLFVPNTNPDQKSFKGEVLEVGPGKRLEDGTQIKNQIKKGDRVWFSKFVGVEVDPTGKPDGDTYLVMKEEDILGVE